ncbi:MAG: patatin-like phospholipase family protein [Pseudomonadota bacterium]
MTDKRPKLGVAWGSGAARGWAHVGVIRALNELNIAVDVEAGCSVGALVSAARRLDAWDAFMAWALEIGPVGALGQFALQLGAGGLINPSRAFETFRYADRNIEDLDAPWGAVATDLATGQEVWLTAGSVIEAARASSAIPMVMQAAAITVNGSERWLIDGAASNPVPVSLARALGADRVIAVDLTASAVTLKRFARPATREVVMVEAPERPSGEGLLPDVVSNLISDTRDYITRELTMAKAKALAKPQFFETAGATIDIVQAHLAQARAQIDVADVRIIPKLDDISPAAFDQHEEIIERGYSAAMAVKEQLLALDQAAR